MYDQVTFVCILIKLYLNIAYNVTICCSASLFIDLICLSRAMKIGKKILYQKRDITQNIKLPE